MKFLKRYSMALYLGAVLAALDFSYQGWQFYAVMIPVVVLAEWKAS